MDILEIDGPCELLTVAGYVFLRIEDKWQGKVEYLPVTFQATSINAVLKKLGKDVPRVEAEEFAVMLAAESCIEHKAEQGLLSEDADKQWRRYQKLKELSLRPGTSHEGMTATKAALKIALNMAL